MYNGLPINDLIEHLTDERLFDDIVDIFSIIQLVSIQSIISLPNKRIFSIYSRTAIEEVDILKTPTDVADYLTELIAPYFDENYV